MRFTNFLLAVIAACLMALTVDRYTTAVDAQGNSINCRLYGSSATGWVPITASANRINVDDTP